MSVREESEAQALRPWFANLIPQSALYTETVCAHSFQKLSGTGKHFVTKMCLTVPPLEYSQMNFPEASRMPSGYAYHKQQFLPKAFFKIGKEVFPFPKRSFRHINKKRIISHKFTCKRLLADGDPACVASHQLYNGNSRALVN